MAKVTTAKKAPARQKRSKGKFLVFTAIFVQRSDTGEYITSKNQGPWRWTHDRFEAYPFWSMKEVEFTLALLGEDSPFQIEYLKGVAK